MPAITIYRQLWNNTSLSNHDVVEQEFLDALKSNQGSPASRC